MNKSKLRGWLWGIEFLITVLVLVIKVPVLVLEFEDNTYYVNSDHFDLSWIHSVEKEEWIESYNKQGDQLLLTETKFKTFGAGVPSQADAVSLEDGFVKMKVNQSFEELNLTVSSNVKTTIMFEHKIMPLYDYADDYSVVHIFIEKLPLWCLFKGGF